MGRRKSRQCEWVKSDGVRCRRFTSDPSGLCPVHRSERNKAAGRYAGDVTLRCEVCQVKDTCPFAFKDPDGFCYLETHNPSLQLRDKAQVDNNLRRVLRNEINILRRLNRVLTLSNDPNTMREYRMLSAQVENHIRDYGVYSGYDERKKVKKEENKTRLMILQQIFGSPEKGLGLNAKPELKQIFGKPRVAFVPVPKDEEDK